MRAALMAGLLVLMAGCTPGPRPIAFGEENCAHCVMTISDARYAAELVTTTGKVYTFDSIECMVSYLQQAEDVGRRVHSLWVTDFHQPETLVPVEEAFFLQSDALRSPMGLSLAAFGPQQAREEVLQAYGGQIFGWDDVLQLVHQHEPHVKHAVHPMRMGR